MTRNDHNGYGDTNTHHTCPHAYEPLLVGWIVGVDWTMRARGGEGGEGANGAHHHAYEPLLIGWFMGAEGEA
jgi:hypothetical protein